MILAVAVGHELWRALSFAFGMTWEVLWALILGFALSGVVQAVVSKREMRRLLPDDSPKTLVIASGLGAASSSCSYASVALARSADFLIESFPRCASSFAVAAFQLAQEPRSVRVAFQTHAPGHVIAAVRRRIPALVLIREPQDVIVSNLVRHPERGVNGLLRGFLRFYEPLMQHRSGFVVATFDEVVGGGFGSVIRRVNERFGTSFSEFEATDANVQRLFKEIDAEWERRRGGRRERLERIVPRPSKLREGMKERLVRQFRATASPRYRDRAQDLYDSLAN